MASRDNSGYPQVYNDEPSSFDKLGRDKIAYALGQLAKTCETPLVIGLFGTWGIGKTSLMEQISRNLDTDDIQIVRFNPWMHQFDENPLLAFTHVLAECSPRRPQSRKLFKIISKAMTSALLNRVSGVTLQDIKSLNDEYDEENFIAREARVKLHENFTNLVELVCGDKKRIVFFIDDLDRCSPETTLSILESLKLYFNSKKCVYFIGIDRKTLQESILQKYPNIKDAASTYIDKIIQVPFNVPPIEPSKLKTYILDMLPEDLRDCASIPTNLLEGNPRNIKRFINTLNLCHFIALESGIEDYNPQLLSLLLYTQIKNYMLFKYIAQHPNSLYEFRQTKKQSFDVFDNFLHDDIDQFYDIIEKIDDSSMLDIGKYISLAVTIQSKNVESDLTLNADDVFISYAKCCNPLPGEPIIGYITREQGVVIHRINCTKVKYFEKERLLQVSWVENIDK